MIMLLFVGALLAVVSFFTFVVPVQTPVAALTPSAESVAATLLRDHKAAVTWCQQAVPPCADGPFDLAGLGADSALAAGYRQAPWVAVTVSGGILATYVADTGVPVQSVTLALIGLSHGNRNVGLSTTDGGGVRRVLSAHGPAAWTGGTLAVPTAVPIGVPVAVTRVN
jgi:hypothetical protein